MWIFICCNWSLLFHGLCLELEGGLTDYCTTFTDFDLQLVQTLTTVKEFMSLESCLWHIPTPAGVIVEWVVLTDLVISSFLSFLLWSKNHSYFSLWDEEINYTYNSAVLQILNLRVDFLFGLDPNLLPCNQTKKTVEHQAQVYTEESKLMVLYKTKATVSPWPPCLWDRCFDVKTASYTLSITTFSLIDSRRGHARSLKGEKSQHVLCDSWVRYRETIMHNVNVSFLYTSRKWTKCW